MSDTTQVTDTTSPEAQAAAAAAEAEAAAANEAATAGQEPGDNAGEPTASNGKPFATANGKSLGFPKETPWREMSADEQAAYWMHQSKGWQRKAENAGAPEESEELKNLRAENEQLKNAQLSDEQRVQADALDAAKQAGIDEAEAHYKPLLRNLLLENIATGVLGEDKAKEWAPTVREDAFLTDEGDLDGAAVLAHLRTIYGEPEGGQKAPVPGTYQQAGQFQPGGKTRPNHSAQAEAQIAKRFGSN
ncbi:scaffolding protein [Gordonia phage SpeedDemon]|nr:scaffolding protein [Gordonia phage SpeedDemon]